MDDAERYKAVEAELCALNDWAEGTTPEPPKGETALSYWFRKAVRQRNEAREEAAHLRAVIVKARGVLADE